VIGGIPRHVLAGSFGVPESVFEQIPKLIRKW
jgi:hypothetical protein